MIQINVASPLTDLQKETIRFVNENHDKSFGDRNPTLGKMVNCWQCGLRHRSSVQHEPIVYSVGRYEVADDGSLIPDEEKTILIAPQTRNGVLGAVQFAKKRFRPHQHPRTLEARTLVNELFERDTLLAEIKHEDLPDITKCVREAISDINYRIRSKTRRLRAISKLSRRINLGLANKGARV